MPGENYVINGCSSETTTPEVLLYRKLTLEKILLQLLHKIEW